MKISIAEPCHENWDAMTPNKQGAFCHSCVKDVVDFSNKSLEEIKNFFSKPQTGKVCGRFEEKQLQELSFDDFFSRFTYWNFTRKFAAIFFMSFGFWIFSNSSAMAQNDKHMMKGEVAFVPEKTTQQQTQNRMIKGKIARNITTCTSETVTPEKTVKGNTVTEPVKAVEEKYMMMGMVAYKPHVKKDPEVIKTETKITGDTTIVMDVISIVDKKTENVPTQSCLPYETILLNPINKIDTQSVVTKTDVVSDIPKQTDKINEELIIYPNPTGGHFIVETKTDSKQTVNILDENGRLVLTKIIEGTTAFDASHLKAGIYNVTIKDNSSDAVIKKRIVIVK